jgi:hypothetical protein
MSIILSTAFKPIMQIASKLNAVLLNVIMLNAVLLNVVMLSAVILNVIMLNVMAQIFSARGEIVVN